MIVNAHTSWWRRVRRRESPVAEPFPEPRGDEPHDPAYLAELALVWDGCRALPEPQRTAVVLRYYEDLPYDEIAALTGVREGTARSRVSRGLVALRELLSPGGAVTAREAAAGHARAGRRPRAAAARARRGGPPGPTPRGGGPAAWWAVAVAVLVPVALFGLDCADPVDSTEPVPSPTAPSRRTDIWRPDTWRTESWRTESWHDVELVVPTRLGVRGAGHVVPGRRRAAGAGGRASGRSSPAIACSRPERGYGVQFTDAGSVDRRPSAARRHRGWAVSGGSLGGGPGARSMSASTSSLRPSGWRGGSSPRRGSSPWRTATAAVPTSSPGRSSSRSARARLPVCRFESRGGSSRASCWPARTSSGCSRRSRTPDPDATRSLRHPAGPVARRRAPAGASRWPSSGTPTAPRQRRVPLRRGARRSRPTSATGRCCRAGRGPHLEYPLPDQFRLQRAGFVQGMLASWPPGRPWWTGPGSTPGCTARGPASVKSRCARARAHSGECRLVGHVDVAGVATSCPTGGCCSTTCRSGSARAPRSRWSAPTAPARRRCCGSSPASSRRTPAR